MNQDKTFKELLAQYEAQNAELEHVMSEFQKLAESGVELAIPQELLTAFDAACEVRTCGTIQLTALRA
jgi:hypothetical protein